MDLRKRSGLISLLFFLLISTSAYSATTITLSTTPSPSAGQPGITTINVTGSNYPTGTILPSAVTVSLQPASGGITNLTTTPSALTTIFGSTRRVTFTIPSSIYVSVPTAYLISISGKTTTGVQFISGNKAKLTINPPSKITSVSPSKGEMGWKGNITITTEYTTFVKEVTVASFGPGISVGGGTEGGFGLVTVISSTSAIANIVISPQASVGPRTVSIKTGIQQAQLVSGYTVIDTIPPQIAITTPANLITVGSSAITVAGTVDDPTAIVTVNGVSASTTNGSFTVNGVSLTEGMNTIVAKAIDPSNNIATANINISLDSTAPHIAITSPVDNTTVTASPITVTGVINDIVRGTVNENQGRVLVNGIETIVSNRSFIVENVPLNPSENIITAIGSDQVGNTTTTSIRITFDLSANAKINLFSGNNQSGFIGSTLPQPLIIFLNDQNGSPVANKTVVFRVIENNGTLNNGDRAVVVTSDQNGLAGINYTLGTWAGSGNNRVKAEAVGFTGSVIFTASALQKMPSSIYVAQGDQQKGAINQRLPEPFVAFVTDEGHNPLQNVSVRFIAVEGGGNFDSGLDNIIINTDSDGRATVSFILGPDEGNDHNIVEATFEGLTGSPASFRATGLRPGDPGNTRISGVVMDNTNIPIINVTMRVEGTTREAKTDAQGQFIIENVPVGPVHLIADGSTASELGVKEYPNLMYEITTIAGANNSMNMPIYLLPLDLNNAKWVGGDQDIIYTIPEIPGFSLTIKANSVTFPDGKKQGRISVTQVHADKVPMVPQIGQQPRFIVTIQPPGVVFDPPAPVTIPNVDGLAPGEKTNLYSFDHDLGIFVSIGTGTVSDDGSIIASDPGVGVVKAGWHCGGNPQRTGSVNNCPECQKCTNNRCVNDEGRTCRDDGNVCTADKCQGGICGHPKNYDPATQCCDNQFGKRAKSPIADLSQCPNRVAKVGYTPTFNGCTGSPENPNICAPAFTPACNIHDICYGTCNSGKSSCDSTFRSNLLAICDTVSDLICQLDCRSNANLYADVVNFAPSFLFYDPGQKEGCQCCP